MLRIAIGLGVLAALVALLFYLAGPSAFAHELPCRDSAAVERFLEGQHRERVIGFGVVGRDGALMRLWSTPGGETWTITVTVSEPRAESGFATCIMSSGEAYRPKRIERGDQS